MVARRPRSGDAEARDAYARRGDRGFVPCQVYSVRAPEGEFGHVDVGRLHAFDEADFQTALELLATCEFARFERHVCMTVGFQPVVTV
jgi:hypothetical protein